MVQALVERGSDDCEALFEHYRGAGDPENASIQAGLAAEKAGTALAFDRAASFYRHALALTPASSSAHAWKEGLANALANAGRPAEAADAYLHAAEGAGHARRVELQRRGAEQFLIAGDIDRGLELIRAVLTGMGMSVPRSTRAALLSLLWRRARLRWRGLSFVPRHADKINADTLLLVDTCWSATTGLLLVDMISAIDFSARHLLMALDAGEPSRIARAMAIESAARGAYPAGRTLSESLVRQSKALAQSVGNPYAIALSILADGMMATAGGEWKKALTLSEEALAILRDQCVGVTWELNMAQNLVIWALMYLGELGEVSRRVPALLADARSRGNWYIATELCTRSNFVWLAADDPDEGERVTVESIGRWSQKGFHRQHYSARLARVQTALYRGDAETAWRLLTEQESMLRRSLLTRIRVIRVESLYLRARCALAMAAGNRSSRRFLSVARAAARRIARERMPWSDPIALLVSAGIAYLEGSTPLAVRSLHDAVDRFDRADMNLYAAVARRRIGALQGDAPGRELRRQAEAWMLIVATPRRHGDCSPSRDDAAAFVADARPSPANRVVVFAGALRPGDGCQERELPTIPVHCPRRSSPHRQRADAMVRSDCIAGEERDSVPRGQYTTRREIPLRRRRLIRPRRHELVCSRGPAPNRRAARRRARARASATGRGVDGHAAHQEPCIDDPHAGSWLPRRVSCFPRVSRL